ncbi:MurR/RpiR family transcriptional regulator [Rhodococcus rhodnii]|uniref:MurR/RpiR family transcriptional regulator n=1 Tax=Rhodococcus rhodnii TaxID=38312 RepID=UPI000ACDC2BA|nr:MurR/RpiR family transcriptional regulator [Rhodococcus rhodnii]
MGTVVSSIRAGLSALAPSERRVAEVCLDRPDEVAWFSAADLAGAAGTSTATVVRTCQNLGFGGFQQLRMLLLRDLGSRHGDDPEAGERSGPLLVQTIVREVASDLAGSLSPLSHDALGSAVDAVRGAERVLVVGNGGSAPAAASFAVRMLGSGRRVDAPTDAILQQVLAQQLGDGDVLVAVSDTGLNPRTVEVAEAACAAGAVVVGVTAHPRSRLARLADHPLVVGGGAGPYSGHSVSAPVIQTAFLLALAQVCLDVTDDARSIETVAALIDPTDA